MEMQAIRNRLARTIMAERRHITGQSQRYILGFAHGLLAGYTEIGNTEWFKTFDQMNRIVIASRWPA